METPATWTLALQASSSAPSINRVVAPWRASPTTAGAVPFVSPGPDGTAAREREQPGGRRCGCVGAQSAICLLS
ncbi:hypothetical protein M011DRAFT_463319 [Sporormia fimetaria CBS 119925]|uniref:Uncharacterized protein n=1 Tax=Sporormia fimetaria CBS 119925 TaxID=1340428 RepID=A0A6A6VNT5_9PLEO|nr:hypothetical protein M011DRAFT_463319 [Sporormia fimetaria CBS 119925]